MQFSDLSVDLLPLILCQLSKSCHLANARLVSKTFYTFAAPALYERVCIRHASSQTKLFRTLAHNRRLALHIHFLEISGPLQVLNHKLIFSGLRNCSNLYSFNWTCHSSLMNHVVIAVQSHCPHLRHLAVKGFHVSALTMLKFTCLTELSLTSLSKDIIDALPDWLRATGGTLRSLALDLLAGPGITDAEFTALAPFLVNLRHLSVSGLRKGGHEGISAILAANVTGIQSLFLGILVCIQDAFDITTFARLCCARLRTLSRLTSLTIKGAFCLDETLAKLLFNTLAHSPLRHFEVLSTIVCPQLGESFWTRMVEDHGAHLRTVSVHFPPLSISAVQEVCRGCVQLEELYVEVEVEVEVATDTLGGDPLARLFRHMARLLNGLADGLSLAPHLRRVHFKLRCHHGMHPTWLAGPDCSQAILDVVRRCSSRLTLIGLNSKAWRVERQVVVDNHSGEMRTEPKLRQIFGDIGLPQIFTVWHLRQ